MLSNKCKPMRTQCIVRSRMPGEKKMMALLIVDRFNVQNTKKKKQPRHNQALGIKWTVVSTHIANLLYQWMIFKNYIRFIFFALIHRNSNNVKSIVRTRNFNANARLWAFENGHNNSLMHLSRFDCFLNLNLNWPIACHSRHNKLSIYLFLYS